MLIFITGYMGAGKSTMGKILADRLNLHFYDLDHLVEAFMGQTIGEFFEKYGEQTFRKIEREVLTKYLDEKDTVIATGGGTACYEDNMDLMNRSGITVFLDTPVKVILNRLTRENSYRPLLKHIPPGDLPEFIQGHLDSRRKFYSKALIRVAGEDIGAIIDAVRFKTNLDLSASAGPDSV